MIVTILKAVHIAALVTWVAGLIALPLMLARHEEGEHQWRYTRIRRFTHFSYTRLVTPAAIVAIVAGTPLIFLRELFVPWLFAKLALVGMLVALHAYVGHVVLTMGEQPDDRQPPPAWPMTAGVFAVTAAILVLVLSKPSLEAGVLPDFLQRPMDRHLPLDEVPS